MAPTAHARLSPSSAARWLRCPGSVQFIDDLDEPDQAGDAASEGTILHYIAEQCLRENETPYGWVDRTVSLSDIAEWTGNGDGGIDETNDFSLEIDEDMADGIMAGLDRIDEIAGKLFIEKRLDLGRWMPGQFGTMDVGIAGKKRITCFDWKFGYLPVSPVENDQLRIYALGFWENYARHVSDAHEFRLIIWQPRAPGGGGEWDISLDELLDFGRDLKIAAQSTYKKGAKRIAGSHCDACYCPGAKTLACPEYGKFNLDMVRLDFDSMEDDADLGLELRTPSVAGLTPKQAAHIALHRSTLNKFFDRVHARVRDDALKGRPTPGVKAVEGRQAPRKWVDAEDATDAVVEAAGRGRAFTRKLITPTKLEELVSPETYADIARDHITRADSKPVLVPEGDARPAMRSVVDEFNED